jgi:hypothetical protein
VKFEVVVLNHGIKGTGRVRVQIVHLLMEGGGVILDQSRKSFFKIK